MGEKKNWTELAEEVGEAAYVRIWNFEQSSARSSDTPGDKVRGVAKRIKENDYRECYTEEQKFSNQAIEMAQRIVASSGYAEISAVLSIISEKIMSNLEDDYNDVLENEFFQEVKKFILERAENPEKVVKI